MRTTIDLPDDLHRIALAISRDKSQSLSKTVSELLRRSLQGGTSASVSVSAKTGLPVIRIAKTITTEDVRSLEDD